MHTIPHKRVTILGSTGSIGVQALEVIAALGWQVTGLAAHSSVDSMEQQIRQYRPGMAAMYDPQAAADLRVRVADLPVTILSGPEGVNQLAAADCDMVLNAVVGMVGLVPTLTAIEAGHSVALANKETLVAGGKLVMEAVKRHQVNLLPVDSEHSAIFQCLQGMPPSRPIKRLILTASGGPFFGKSAEQLQQVTKEQALRHPNWDMGAKITVDSATIFNKGLELIEARWLFDLPPQQIEVVVHRESVVHSLVEFADHSVLAQMGVPDMRIPIQYALTWPERLPSPAPRLQLTDYATLRFATPDDQTFPAISICRQALVKGGLYPAAVNAANEQAVALFLQDKIRFADIVPLAAKPLEMTLHSGDYTVQDVLDVYQEIKDSIGSFTSHPAIPI